MRKFKKNNLSKKKEEEAILENYKWFSRFSPVEKLKIAKRASEFAKILKNAK